MKLNIFAKGNLTILKAMKKISANKERCLIIVDNTKKLLGLLSDGDLRRGILNNHRLDTKIEKIYNHDIKFLNKKNCVKSNIDKIFKNKKINLIPIVNKSKIVINYLSRKKIYNNFINKKKLDCDVVIMSGGKGTRLKPYTNILPKPLLQVNNKTMIENIIDGFRENGISSFFISINYKSKLIKSFFEELSPKYKVKFVEEKKPLGTAGSLYMLKKKIKNFFFVINCDTILDINFSKVLEHHKKNKNDLTVIVAVKEDVIPYGICKIDDLGKLIEINEKPKINNLINIGCYLLNKKIIQQLKQNDYLDFNELINSSINRKLKVGVYPIDESQWTDLGNAPSLSLYRDK
tara:strand:+ start:1442 stop:2485 length:1044 start_codon:yes stop_codon:yes gene_type:complete